MTQFNRLEDDASLRRLLYTGAILFIVIPFLQAGQALWPLQLSDIRWRYGAASALSSILLLPFFGLVLMLTLAKITENKGVARLVGALASLLVVGLLGSLVLFALDALQLKTIVNSQAMQQFESTSLRVVIVTLVFSVAFSLLMVTAFKNSRGDPAAVRKGSKVAEEGVGLIVGR